MINDPLGHVLLKERLLRTVPHLLNQWEEPHGKRTSAPPHAHWVITGVGSSEAHARFLVHLIHTYSRATAEYRPLSAFLERPPMNAHHAGLIVFSQGLSPNACLALRQHQHFAHTILFSAPIASILEDATEAMGLLVEQLIQSHSVTWVPFGEDTERGLLVRTLGPISGYLAAIEWLQNTYPPGPKKISKVLFQDSLEQAMTTPLPFPAKKLLHKIQEGEVFVMGASPEIEYSQNLAYKLIESLFLIHVRPQEILSFVHGSFQSLRYSQKKPVCLLLDQGSHKKQNLIERLQDLIDKLKGTSLFLRTNLPAPYTILAYELMLGQWTQQLLEETRLDIKNWPGKGEDPVLYEIDRF